MASQRKVSFTAARVDVVNRGASFGPRIATARFRNQGWFLRPRLDVVIAAEVDGRQYQDESAVRRRAGRAAVPVGRRVAQAIASGALAAEVRFVSRDPDWAQAVWLHREEYEGHARVVRIIADFRCDGQPAVALRAPVELAERGAALLKTMADDLHAALDDPTFADVFGGR